MDWQDQQPEIGDTEIDEAFRFALRRRVNAAQPPDRVWQRLRSQMLVNARPPRRFQVRDLSRLLAPLVQGLVATCLLLLLGMGMRVSLWEQAYRFGATDAERPTLTAPLTSPVTTSSIAEAAGAGDPLDDRESLRSLLRAEGHAAGGSAAEGARPHVFGADQQLTALDKLDNRIDARDVTAPAVVTHPVAGAKAGPAPRGRDATPVETPSPERIQPF